MDTRISAREWYERGRTLRQSKMYDQALKDLRQSSMIRTMEAKPRHKWRCACALSGATKKLLRPSDTRSTHRLSHRMSLCMCCIVLGQSLEALGRNAEALEAYGWVRQADEPS